MSAVTDADYLRWRLPSFQRKVEHTRKVIARALAECSKPYISYSGGKDSTVMLALVHSVDASVPVVWSDHELEFDETVALMQLQSERLGERFIALSGYDRHAGNDRIGSFRAWTDPPFWRDPLPGSLDVPHISLIEWAIQQGYDCTFLGLRAGESGRRRLYLGTFGPLRKTAYRVYCNPLARWTTDEIWAAIAGMGLPYNAAYDVMMDCGLARDEQRIMPLQLEPMWLLQRGWPEMYRRLIERYGERW